LRIFYVIFFPVLYLRILTLGTLSLYLIRIQGQPSLSLIRTFLYIFFRLSTLDRPLTLDLTFPLVCWKKSKLIYSIRGYEKIVKHLVRYLREGWGGIYIPQQHKDHAASIILKLYHSYLIQYSTANMVKNTKGGNKSKGIARKHITGAREGALRLSTCDLEKYGVVIRVLGNGMFYVVTDLACDKQPQLLGHIRNKFRGRSKRDNNIVMGSVVLVGLREWEDPNYKECDLLEVYSPNEVRQLMKNPSIDLSELQKHIDAHGSAGDASLDAAAVEISFSEERDYMDGLIPEDGEEESAEFGDGAKMEEIVDAEDL